MLHCVGLYPVKEEDVQLNCMTRMINRYPDISIGYSGHEAPTDYNVTYMAIAKGAVILERHVGLATDSIQLNAYSIDMNEVDQWVEAIISARKICGNDKEKKISQAEITSLDELARGCYARVPIHKGQEIKRDDVFFAMPCASGQTTSGQFIEGMIATKDYKPREAIYEKREV